MLIAYRRGCWARWTTQLTLGLLACLWMPRPSSLADTVTLECVKDNTLIESATGMYSNGLGDGIFCGRIGSNGGGLRLRAALMFDLTSIPPGSTINSASLKLVLVQGHGGTQTHALYRLLTNWGEGTSYGTGGTGGLSTPGDLTWMHTYYDNAYWSTPGGDFVAASSASASVGNSGSTTWSSGGLAADVQYWVDNPANNFGWIIRGNEVTLATAKKFVSRNWNNNPDTPRLTINFTPPPLCVADLTHDGTVNVNDLLMVIDSWGPCPAPPSVCPADIEPPGGSGTVDINDLLKVLSDWGPCP